MNLSDRRMRRYARQAWVAFCSGWWLAGVILGVEHFLDLLARPSPEVLEAVGVSVVMGGLLPGGAPFWYAADIMGVRGLPVGFTGFLIGAIISMIVWTSLPFALSIHGGEQPNSIGLPEYQIVAAIPYIAAGAGLVHLFRTYRAWGLSQLLAGFLALGSAAIAYVTGAALIFTVGSVFLV